MTPQDREFIELVAESAAIRAAEKVKTELKDCIEEHQKRCELASENKNLKLGLKAMAALTLAGGVAGAFGSKIKDIVLNVYK
jgi:hypothetical protein